MFTIRVEQVNSNRAHTFHRDTEADVIRKLNLIRRAYNMDATVVVVTREDGREYYRHDPPGKPTPRAKAVLGLASERGLEVRPFADGVMVMHPSRQLDKALMIFWSTGPDKTTFYRYDEAQFIQKITTADAVNMVADMA